MPWKVDKKAICVSRNTVGRELCSQNANMVAVRGEYGYHESRILCLKGEYGFREANRVPMRGEFVL